MKNILIFTITAALSISAASCGQNAQKQTTEESSMVTPPEQSVIPESDNEWEDDGSEKHPIDIRMDKELEEKYSTSDICDVYIRAAEAWEAEINKNVQTLTERMNGGAGIQKLQAAQKAYEAFYKNETDFNENYWTLFSGTMYIPFTYAFRAGMGRHRAFQLLGYYDKNGFYDIPFEEITETKTEEEWDKMLNDNYKALMAKLGKEHQDKLRESQRKWITYRDAEDDCYNANCLIIMNPEYRLLLVRERALRLKTYLDNFSIFG